MSRARKKLPIPTVDDPKVTWTYFISRDTVAGALSGTCHLWYVKPLRTCTGNRVTWVDADHRAPGFIGEYRLIDIERWFGAERIPESDIMLMKIEQTPTFAMLEEYAKQAAKQ